MSSTKSFVQQQDPSTLNKPIGLTVDNCFGDAGFEFATIASGDHVIGLEFLLELTHIQVLQGLLLRLAQ